LGTILPRSRGTDSLERLDRDEEPLTVPEGLAEVLLLLLEHAR